MADKKQTFEGQSVIETSYSLTFEEVMDGFASVEAVKKNPQRVVGTGVLLLCAVMLIPTLDSSIALFGLVMLLIVCYLLFRVWYLPILRRRKVAKSIAEKQMLYRIRLYETGVQIEEREHHYNLSYKNLQAYEAKNCLILVCEGQMIILPKRYWKEQLEAARQRLQGALEARYLDLRNKRDKSA